MYARTAEVSSVVPVSAFTSSAVGTQMYACKAGVGLVLASTCTS